MLMRTVTILNQKVILHFTHNIFSTDSSCLAPSEDDDTTQNKKGPRMKTNKVLFFIRSRMHVSDAPTSSGKRRTSIQIPTLRTKIESRLLY